MKMEHEMQGSLILLDLHYLYEAEVVEVEVDDEVVVDDHQKIFVQMEILQIAGMIMSVELIQVRKKMIVQMVTRVEVSMTTFVKKLKKKTIVQMVTRAEVSMITLVKKKKKKLNLLLSLKVLRINENIR